MHFAGRYVQREYFDLHFYLEPVKGTRSLMQ